VQPITIVHCGELERLLKKKRQRSRSPRATHEKKGSKKSRTHEHRRKRSVSSSSTRSSVSSSDNGQGKHQLRRGSERKSDRKDSRVQSSNIDERNPPAQKPRISDAVLAKLFGPTNESPSRYMAQKESTPRVDSEGRIIKGRGFVKYH
jgi:hypothetical protein